MHIVVIQTAFLGDLLLSIPLLKNIRFYYPKCHISLVARKGLGEILLQEKLVDTNYEILKGDRRSYQRVQTSLNQEGIDLVFCPHQSYRTAWFVSGLKVKGQKIGFRWWGSGLFFDVNVAYDKSWPDALRQMLLLKQVNTDFKKRWVDEIEGRGFENIKNSSETVALTTPLIPQWASMQLMNENSTPSQRQIVLVPGSVWATKRWTESGFAELAQKFIARGYGVILLGSPEERELCRRIQLQVTEIQNKAGGLSIKESIQVMRESQLVVSNDSGAMHLASVAGAPCVAIFGPTTLALGYRPWNSKSYVVQKQLSCRPCGKHGHQTCPIGTHECMKSISSDEVFKVALNLL